MRDLRRRRARRQHRNCDAAGSAGAASGRTLAALHQGRVRSSECGKRCIPVPRASSRLTSIVRWASETRPPEQDDLRGETAIGPSHIDGGSRRILSSKSRRRPFRIRTMALPFRATLFLSTSASVLLGLNHPANSQTTAAAGGSTTLPSIEVVAPRRPQTPRRPKTHVVTTRRSELPAAPPPPSEAQVVASTNEKLETARQTIVAPVGATSYQVNHQAIEALPQGKQCAARQGAVAVSGRDAGLRGKRRTACPQRARQHAVPHQRHHAARRRRRLRANPRHRHCRQPGAIDRRAARAIWLANRRRAGHPDQDRRLQQLRQRQRLWRQPRHDHAEFRIWRHGRADPVFRVRPLFPEQSGNRKSDAVERRHSRPHVAGKGISLIFRPCSIRPAA